MIDTSASAVDEPGWGDYHGYPTRRLESRYLWVEALAAAGPRLVRLGRAESAANVLAETPDEGWETPFGRYLLFGGHRLWNAPEDPERSVVPDVEGLVAVGDRARLRLTGRVEAPTGLVRSIVIELDDAVPSMRVDHELCNEGPTGVSVSPWSITQLPLGGRVILPQRRARRGHDVRPNRSLVLWPYTSWADERLGLNDGALVVVAVTGGDLKIGYFNDAGWVAYVRQGIALVRRFEPRVGAVHPDLGCNVETYAGPRYLELEILGPLVELQPGESARLTERWELVNVPDAERHDPGALVAGLAEPAARLAPPCAARVAGGAVGPGADLSAGR